MFDVELELIYIFVLQKYKSVAEVYRKMYGGKWRYKGPLGKISDVDNFPDVFLWNDCQCSLILTTQKGA